MSDSEFMRRIAPPGSQQQRPQIVLWTLRKSHRLAEARIRLIDQDATRAGAVGSNLARQRESSGPTPSRPTR